ncbi:MAG: NAD(P)/FAD-dependent oxidoreductase [Anaerofustis stercorihominis]|nr:NAD(P)/FAD-dependent oxidoreductase [Anaerofustis stercorihominis]
MKKVVIIGGGAAGMMASVFAARGGADVLLIEANEKLGKKIYITGKGRCNYTNATDTEDFFNSVFEGKRFAYSSVYGFDHTMLMELFESAGMKSKIERGNRVFPQSDKASDVTKALKRLMDEAGVEVSLGEKVRKIIAQDGQVKAVKTDKRTVECDSVILCTGGKSYPTTGSDGNGYALAKDLGHTIETPRAALVPFVSDDKWIKNLAGLSLVNVEGSLWINGKLKDKRFGEMLFTHKGISGPIVLTMSCFVEKYENVKVTVDLKPALTREVLDKRILKDFSENTNKEFKNSLDKLMPKSLAAEVVYLSKIDPHKKVNQITAKEREVLVDLIKALPINIKSDAGFNEAIITTGGVKLKEVNPSTMESKLVKGLYMAGEVLNLHGFTGGFNLQLAFSTGHLAGESCCTE